MAQAHHSRSDAAGMGALADRDCELCTAVARPAERGMGKEASIGERCQLPGTPDINEAGGAPAEKARAPEAISRRWGLPAMALSLRGEVRSAVMLPRVLVVRPGVLGRGAEAGDG